MTSVGVSTEAFSLSITIGGDAGQGVESSGALLTQALARGGWHVFGVPDYRSRIRGGHNFFQIRATRRPSLSHSDPVHLLLAFTRETIEVHQHNLAPGAGVIYDDSFRVDAGALKGKGFVPLLVPLTKIAEEHGTKLMMNTGALGAAAGVLGFPLEPLIGLLHDTFGHKGKRIVEGNVAVAQAAYRYATERYRAELAYTLAGADDHAARQADERAARQADGHAARHADGHAARHADGHAARQADGQAGQADRRRGGRAGAHPQAATDGEPAGPLMVLTGNEAFCLGAVLGGCNFVSAYPMTPATPIFEWMVAREKQLGVVTKHAEDEIAAVCMAIGAGFVGARALVPTSGGGFSLMTEALGMAGMCEVPVVIANVQRGGPSTGLPTRTEQGDLLFVLHASQGEFPRIVLAPGTHEQCYEAGWRAFNLAEKYQCPVIVLSDQFLAASRRSLPVDAFTVEGVHIDRGALLTDQELDKLEDPYLRYALTETGISPRALPGHPRAVFTSTTDEHGEDGHITEEIDLRVPMMDKRMRKLEMALADMRGPDRYGPEDADVTLICWGSTVGPARESLPLLAAEGVRANVLHFTDLWPLPVAKVEKALRTVRYSVAVEQNYTGQFARFLRMMTGFQVDGHVLKYDGRPFAPQQIAARVLEEVGVRV